MQPCRAWKSAIAPIFPFNSWIVCVSTVSNLMYIFTIRRFLRALEPIFGKKDVSTIACKFLCQFYSFDGQCLTLYVLTRFSDELFQEMDKVGVRKDVVTYNAVLDAVASQIGLGRKLFEEGVEKGFYARVSRLGEQWFELDLHFLSLGGGEIALGWWFEECLVNYLCNTSRLASVKSISIVTGYGKTRLRGRRQGDDGMRKRCRAMLDFMNIRELKQQNTGRIHIDKEALIEEVGRNVSF